MIVLVSWSPYKYFYLVRFLVIPISKQGGDLWQK